MTNNLLRKKTHVVYYNWHIDRRAGGPTGYLENLRYGLDRISNPEGFNIYFHTKDKQMEVNENRSFFRDIFHGFRKSKTFNEWYVSHHPKYISSLKNFVKFVSDLNGMLVSSEEKEFFSSDTIRTIHCHTFYDAIKVHNVLKLLNKRERVKLIFTSHMPEAPAIEIINEFLEKGYKKSDLNELEQNLKVAQLFAFECSDILIFPSKEAMEPYYQTVGGFETLVNKKDIRFLPTGSVGLEFSEQKLELREKFGIKPGVKVVSFIGRHNHVKGYDFLCTEARDIINKRKDILFLIAGKTNAAFPPLKSTQWKELGWVNPTELLSVSDLFVLPNRRTYFDLILLEALSVGVPILASKTGGNVSVYKSTDIINLFEFNSDLSSSFKTKFYEIIDYDEDKKNEIRNCSIKMFKSNYSATVFAENYINILNDIYKDYML